MGLSIFQDKRDDVKDPLRDMSFQRTPMEDLRI